MLRDRLRAGTLLALGVLGVLYADRWLAPYYPVLGVLALLAGTLTAGELCDLLRPDLRPRRLLTMLGVATVLAANWFGPLLNLADTWFPVWLAYVGFVLAAFLYEVLAFRAPGDGVARVMAAAWAVAYLGLLPSFLIQLRWFDRGANPTHSSFLIALVIFVPKCGDIGAYAVGRLVGRTPFAPRLSPKKTWEGFAGGLLASMLTAALADLAHPMFPRGRTLEALAFGFAVGLAGVVGDLAESLIKRDMGKKDAAASVPGFGGLLDVLDSLLFAAPVAYVWLYQNSRFWA